MKPNHPSQHQKQLANSHHTYIDNSSSKVRSRYCEVDSKQKQNKSRS